MDLHELGIVVLQFLLANVPALVLIVTTITSSLKKVKSEVGLFNSNMLNTKDVIIKKLEEKVEKITNKLDEKIEKTVGQVEVALSNIGNMVNTFNSKIAALENQANQVFKTNKISLEIISELVCGNERLVTKGTAAAVLNKIEVCKHEIERFPELISNDLELLEKVLKEQLLLLGDDSFDSLITRVTRGRNR